MKHPTRCAAAVLLVAGLATGCGPPHGADSTVVVFAASSLKNAFTAIGGRFTADNPGTGVEFVFAGSADLLAQLTEGAPADVFAPADTATMDRAVDAGLPVGSPIDFAVNTLTIVVAAGNPRNITSLADLARPGLAVVVCAAQVPCGAATQRAEEAAGVTLNPASEESQVSDVLTKVTSGQADAGIVYRTDARAAGGTVTAVGFPESAGAVNTYPIAVLRQARDLDLAQRFTDLVTGESGRAILTAAGFAAAGR